MTRWADIAGMGDDYDDQWRRLAAAGASIHGEADLIASFAPTSVLDAGCGTGRVAIELDRRGIDVVGVDVAPPMLQSARRKAPHLTMIEADLVDVTVTDPDGEQVRLFDVVAMPGNVMIFIAPGTEQAVVANMARHLVSGGRLVAGFQLDSGRLRLDDYDRAAVAAGLVLEHRWSTWDRAEFRDGDYAVTVHRLAA